MGPHERQLADKDGSVHGAVFSTVGAECVGWILSGFAEDGVALPVSLGIQRWVDDAVDLYGGELGLGLLLWVFAFFAQWNSALVAGFVSAGAWGQSIWRLRASGDTGEGSFGLSI